MQNVCWSTFEMMVLTFGIGFFVAGLIKLVAVWADYLHFHSSYHDEIIRLKRLRKIQMKVAEVVNSEFIDNFYEQSGDKANSFKKGINTEFENATIDGYYHGVSLGTPNKNILEYYYPDTKMVFLKQEEEKSKIQKDTKENKSVRNN